ncbi:MAG: long-chain-fatty-acid--CoA ligase [Candidatus Bathyarchaeia archaeon]
MESYSKFSSRYPLQLKAFLTRPVKVCPDKIGVVYRNPRTRQYFRFKYIEWYKRICQLANFLKIKLNVNEGDVVSTLAFNNHRHLELYYAVPCIGAVLNTINVRYSLDQIEYVIKHAQPKVLFFDDDLLYLLENVYDRIKSVVKAFVYMSDEPKVLETKITPLHSYEDSIKKEPSSFDWPDLDENKYATLCYTSGTTGLPKGVRFTHRQIYLHTVHTSLNAALNADPAIQRLGEASVVMINVPLFHIHGWGTPFSSVLACHKIVLPGRFTPDGFCELVQTEKVTSTSLVPTMLAMLVEYLISTQEKYDLSSLKYVGVGGAALPPGLKAAAEKTIPGFVVSSGYGMTETCPVISGAHIKSHMVDWPKEKLDEIRVKTGIPIIGLEVDVIDEEGRPVPRDGKTIGEIVVRGPWVAEEYYKDPEKTREAWKGGWFHTGDLAVIDEEGYLIIVDRVKDVIRSGAEMVPTVLLENITMTMDAVSEVAYIGVPDDKWGERPLALIKLKKGSSCTEDDVYKFLLEQCKKGRIAKWMLPDYIAIVEEIPLTSVGKYDKKVIKERLNEYLQRAKRVHKR